jgi:adenylate cyclase
VAQLVIYQGDDCRTLELRDDKVVTIGRARDADVHIDDPSLSRRHCEVRKLDGQWLLKDLGSFNGTYCNDGMVSEHWLRHGDRIQLGLTVLTFEQSEQEQRAATAVTENVALPDDPDLLQRRLRNYMALMEITKAVSSVLSTDSLFRLVIEKSLALTNAERGSLIEFTEKGPVFRVARTRDGLHIDDPEKTVSKSIISTVHQTGEPVVTMDAINDFAGVSNTIAHLDIRSLVCAPLKVKDKVLGCIYVDSQISEREFGGEALNLLQAFADQAAIAIDNARLYDEMIKSREQEKRVRQVFQKYVPADVVRRALEMDSTKRLSTKQVCTVLFSDIRGFTSMSERMEPEAVVSFLNDYLQRMVDIVFDEGGIVDKFIGDAVMAVFGAPFPKPDDAVRAVRAGHRMLEEVDRFNEEQAKIGGVHIRIGIGIHTGPVIAGNIGSDKKMEYTVIGDSVNIASRVESLCKEHKTEFLITQGCYDATRRRIAVRPIGPVSVKGKENALMIYEAPRRTVAGQMAHAVPVPAALNARELRTIEAPVVKQTELTGNRTAFGVPDLVAVPPPASPPERRVRPMTIPPPPIRPVTKPNPVVPPPPDGPAPEGKAK